MNKRISLSRLNLFASFSPEYLLKLTLGTLSVFWFSSSFALGEEQAQLTSTNLADLPLEQLMQIEVPTVVSASKYEQKETEAPSSATVINSEDIQRYGYRTLADILHSVPGLYVSYDRDYAFLGSRGVNLGDYNSRILLLIDGHRMNNNISDGAFIDTAFSLDVDLIDHVEIIRGPGSVLYGNNAFFGVINVVTRKGKDVNGAEVSGQFAQYDSHTGRITYGNVFTNGIQLLLSGTIYDDPGTHELYYPQFNTPGQNNGRAENLDTDSSKSLFGSLDYRDFTLEGSWINREKGNPTAQYLTTFNDPRLKTIDERSYVSLKYAHSIPGVLDITALAYYDRYDFQIGYPQSFTAGTNTVNAYSKEKDVGEWWGTELQLNKKLWDRHILTIGAEYRDDFRQDRRVFDPTSGINYSSTDLSRQSFGIYGQGDFTVVTNLHLNAGGRIDRYGDFKSRTNPRVALIYNPFESSAIKAIYGTAFRVPNFLELSDPRFQDIKPEEITSYELVWEQQIGQHLRSSVSGYYNQMEDLIVLQNGYYTNFNADGKGLEMALEGNWVGGIKARLSYSLQNTQDRNTDSTLPDSPGHLVKFDLSVPLYKDELFAGLEFQYTSSRHTVYTSSTGDTLPGPDASGFGVINLTLLSQNLLKNVEFSATIYNLLDTRYGDPATPFHEQAIIPQDGRSFRVKLIYHF